jgi:hypothetical protein
VDLLIDHLKKHVLYRDEINETDSVLVDQGVELFCETFHQLRDDKWLDSWMIMAAMQISDKPSWVSCDYSIPLDIKENGAWTTIERPLAGWKQNILKSRRQEEQENTDSTSAVYFRPLNHEGKHFSLLEINIKAKSIRHYDSMASPDVIRGSTALTRVGKLVKVCLNPSVLIVTTLTDTQEEFSDMEYAYNEVVSGSISMRTRPNMRPANSPTARWLELRSKSYMEFQMRG